MALTLAQLQTLKAAILAETNSTFVAHRNNGDTGKMAEWYAVDAAGNQKCWRNDVSQSDLVEATVENLAVYDNLTPGKRDAWSQFQNAAPIDFNRNKFRSAPGKVWAATERDAILNGYCVRNASRGELVFGSADATEGTVTAKKLNWQGVLTFTDIINALAS